MGDIGAMLATTEVELERPLSDGEAFLFLAVALVVLALVGVLVVLIKKGYIRSPPGDGD